MYFSVNTMHKSSMELEWKYGRLSSIPFLKSSIPFHSGIFHIPYRNFRSIPFHFPFHSIPCPDQGCELELRHEKISIVLSNSNLNSNKTTREFEFIKKEFNDSKNYIKRLREPQGTRDIKPPGGKLERFK